MKGTVKRFYFRKGFGFIEGEPGSEYFFHYSEFSGEKRALRPGLEVEFEPRSGDKGLAATAIRASGPARPEPATAPPPRGRERSAPKATPPSARPAPWRGFAAGVAVGVVVGIGLYALLSAVV